MEKHNNPSPVNHRTALESDVSNIVNVDHRIVKSQSLYQLTKKDISRFWAFFCRLDNYQTGSIEMNDLFQLTLGEERSIVGDAIFELVDCDKFVGQNRRKKNDTEYGTVEKLTFGEFVHGVCTFVLSIDDKIDMMKFIFFIFDKKKKGYIDREDLEFFLRKMNGGMKGIITSILKSTSFQSDGKFDFEEFSCFCSLYPSVLYPSFRIQQSMRVNIIGESWWERKRNQIGKDSSRRELKTHAETNPFQHYIRLATKKTSPIFCFFSKIKRKERS